MTGVEQALRRIAAIGETEGFAWALVGGMAVSVRTEPRFTRDVDLAVSVSSDDEAEALIARLVEQGYVIEALVEQEALRRLATVRLRKQGDGEEPYVDLLFASSGIEDLIVEAAEELEVLPGVTIRVATAEHLLATKILAAAETRPQDRADAIALRAVLDDDGIDRTRAALREIEARGSNRNRDLIATLEGLPSDPSDQGDSTSPGP